MVHYLYSLQFIVSHMSVVLLLYLLSHCTFDTTSNIFNNIVNVNQYVGLYIRRIAMTYDKRYMLIHHVNAHLLMPTFRRFCINILYCSCIYIVCFLLLISLSLSIAPIFLPLNSLSLWDVVCMFEIQLLWLWSARPSLPIHMYNCSRLLKLLYVVCNASIFLLEASSIISR